MKPNIVKAVVAMEKFFTYYVDPEEFASLIGRLDAHTEGDVAMIESLTTLLKKGSQM